MAEASVRPGWPARPGPSDSLFATAGWLRAMRSRLGDELVTLTVPDRVALLASVQRSPKPGEFFDLHHVCVSEAPALPLTDAARAARAALHPPDPPQWTPNLVVMLPGYECVPVGPAAADPVLLGRLVDAAVAHAAGEGLRAVAVLYTRPGAPLAAVLADRGFLALPLSRTWDLVVPEDRAPGYPASLPRKRRAEAARELRQLEAAGVALRHLDPAEATSGPVLGTLAALRAQLVRKYRGGSDEAAERARLESLVHDVASGEPQVFVAEVDGTTVGFALFAAYGDEWHCLCVGYDYRDPRSRLAYFGTAFYAAVPAAAKAGVRRLGYGQGSAHAKRSRGCTGTPLTGWIHTDDPALRAAVRASAAVTELLPG